MKKVNLLMSKDLKLGEVYCRCEHSYIKQGYLLVDVKEKKHVRYFIFGEIRGNNVDFNNFIKLSSFEFDQNQMENMDSPLKTFSTESEYDRIKQGADNKDKIEFNEKYGDGVTSLLQYSFNKLDTISTLSFERMLSDYLNDEKDKETMLGLYIKMINTRLEDEYEVTINGKHAEFFNEALDRLNLKVDKLKNY